MTSSQANDKVFMLYEASEYMHPLFGSFGHVALRALGSRPRMSRGARHHGKQTFCASGLDVPRDGPMHRKNYKRSKLRGTEGNMTDTFMGPVSIQAKQKDRCRSSCSAPVSEFRNLC